MGYYTTYHLQYQRDTFEERLSINKDIDGLEELILETSKWYSHESDMRVLSKKYPTVLFILNGYGEDSEDVWIKYFLNGRMQKCVAIYSFETFDELRLDTHE